MGYLYRGYVGYEWHRLRAVAAPPPRAPRTPPPPLNSATAAALLLSNLLCSNRVSQMTKTYNDIEAVTRLLEEKEKDLELTARIGKELLTANGRLEARVTALEGELRSARDHATQLRHDLQAKNELLQVLTDDTEDPDSSNQEEACAAAALLKRTGALERENRSLRDEAARLAAGADSAEAAEQQLLRDIATQLSSANSEASCLAAELAGERERSADLQQQLDSTSARLHTTERSLHQLKAEHEHTLRILEITKDNQNALASELADAKERYAEVAAHLQEVQEQLRQLRKRGEPMRGLMPSVAAAAGLLPASLHREMHSSVYSELSLDSGIGDSQHQSSMQKVFETVQCASRWSSGSLAGSDEHPLSSSASAAASALRHKHKPPSHDSYLDYSSDTGSDEDVYPGGWGGSGVPGAPGAAELAAALRRLNPAEISTRRALLTASHAPKHRNSDADTISESAVWGAGAGDGLARWRAPHKLQIVKPLEGSLTLHTWAQLAKPTMSGLLEEQEGVGVRGQRSAATLGLRLYRLSDVEEDDEPRLPYAAPVYTLTNSTVLHPGLASSTPSAASSLSSSVLGSAWSSRRSSRRESVAASPAPSRRGSVAPTPARRWSPTATPANSPLLGSPDASPPRSPAPGAAPPSLHSLIASGRRYLSSPAADGSSPSPLTLQTPGSLYTGLVHRSPMEQLTCLKRTLRSPVAPAAASTPAPEPLGVPGAPGSGALEGRRRARAPRPRADLGTVGAPPPAPAEPAYTSSLGTLSSLLFGRKGGLM
ncbi:trafficking kinesin-binding protein milt isoform X2 [Plutella xylostella]|uniref:trafficking kinesin-binding protein milt isoform X2 n=1 Tax=Plutella xylostella TaxID=51655 RepID=UPI0020323A9A|nr:trafficking kinesin-binding protein milt isoform X2 [Plutella xylostella]